MPQKPQPTNKQQGRVRFGICADVHKDIMHDADSRLATFIDEMNRENVDFIIQLGDFCFPAEHNRGFLSIWQQFRGPRYPVLGNHDMQGHHTTDDAVKFLNLPNRYYSFDMNGYHFVVLDANERRESPPPSNPNFPSYIGHEQLKWLKHDLLATDFPTFLFSHQMLQDDKGLDGREEVQALLREVNEKAGWQQVVAALCGDLHVDYHQQISGIHYLVVNSMSNYWIGEDWQHARYNQLIDSHFPWLRYTAPYKDPLYATITVESDGTIVVQGRESEFVGPSPQDLGFNGYPGRKKWGCIMPKISSRILKTGNQPQYVADMPQPHHTYTMQSIVK